jgi:hypothetical protein
VLDTYLLPLTCALTCALRSDLAWKPVAHSLLMLTREDRPRVRLAALRGLGCLFESGGDEALVLLPEALPFLAEVQHDEEPEVEAACHALLQQLQAASGEELAKFLS